jgi:RNA polymerase sigma-70 factor (ECF subfamily)
MASKLDISEGAAKVACHRLKKAYGLAIRTEIAATLPEGADPDEELRYLMETLGNSDTV